MIRLLGVRQAGFCRRIPHSELIGWRRDQHSAATVRRQFLDFFIHSKEHTFIRSSPVVPFNDPSLMFVNAGMNQFKSVLQNERAPPAPRAANSQKCVRVGGKHNDLSHVGTDGSHLTMFEMLGSWSFGDYWKLEACTMAWELLTKCYRLDPSRLFVTYFGGCPSADLAADLEVAEIWRSLGVAPSHILPFSMEDNFWEMGAAGPCGPCTEIHYDQSGDGAAAVNQGLATNIEIWNIVFIQYNRALDGNLTPLDIRHVDTGMGLERMSAVMNNATSSYDTDLFTPLFQTIQKLSKCPSYGGRFGDNSQLDTAYRILADHARMITVCLADRVFPDQNYKLKNVIRRALNIATQEFGVEHNMLQELSYRVIESLGPTFPELSRHHLGVLHILNYEQENHRRLAEKSARYAAKLAADFPAESPHIELHEAVHFYEGLSCLQSEALAGSELDSRLAYRLYESHGMSPADIGRLAALRGLNFDATAFERYLEDQRRQSKVGTALAHSLQCSRGLHRHLEDDIPETRDEFKYEYTRSPSGEYTFDSLTTEVCAMVHGECRVDKLSEGEEGVVFLTETNFYSEAGGQIGDIGVIRSESGVFEVRDTQQLPGRQHLVAHLGRMRSGYLSRNQVVTAQLDPDHRFRCMQNHTATHLLNRVLHTLLPVTCQRSSHVSPEQLKLDFSSFQTVVDVEFLKNVEDRVMTSIRGGEPVTRRLISSDHLQDIELLISLPGEVYPSTVSMIDCGGSQEPCCGTHLANTADIQNFVIRSLRSPSTGLKSLRCLTGQAALTARQRGQELRASFQSFQEKAENLCQEGAEDADQMGRLRTELTFWRSELAGALALVSLELGERVEQLELRLRQAERSLKKSAAEDQMKQAIVEQEGENFLACVLDLPAGQAKFSLLKAAKLVKQDKPVLILARTQGEVTGKSLVPAHLCRGDFTAEQWLRPIQEALGATGSAPRGQDPRLHYNIKTSGRSASPEEINAAFKEAVELARRSLSP